jgi:hypothetical protein
MPRSPLAIKHGCSARVRPDAAGPRQLRCEALVEERVADAIAGRFGSLNQGPPVDPRPCVHRKLPAPLAHQAGADVVQLVEIAVADG